MAIPPDLDVNILRQRIDALSGTVTDLMARLEKVEHRIRVVEAGRTVEAISRLDLALERSPE